MHQIKKNKFIRISYKFFLKTVFDNQQAENSTSKYVLVDIYSQHIIHNFRL